MADLESLGYKSVSEMSTDEALEVLRQIRLSRRIPDKPTRKNPKKKTSPKVNPNTMSATQVAELLKSLGGS